MTIRYAKRSVQIDGKMFNLGDIIPEDVTDEAAIAAHAFDENTVEIDMSAAEDNTDEQLPANDDDEVYTIVEEGAELLQSDEAIEAPAEEIEEVTPATVVTPVVPAKGKDKK